MKHLLDSHDVRAVLLDELAVDLEADDFLYLPQIVRDPHAIFTSESPPQAVEGKLPVCLRPCFDYQAEGVEVNSLENCCIVREVLGPAIPKLPH